MKLAKSTDQPHPYATTACSADHVPAQKLCQTGLSTDAIDVQVVNENTADDPAILAELLGSMLEETPRLMERIGLAIENSDHDSLRFQAHILKGSAALVGATDTSTAAAKLELIGSGDDPNKVGQLHDDLKSRVDTMLNALAVLCDTPSDS